MAFDCTGVICRRLTKLDNMTVEDIKAMSNKEFLAEPKRLVGFAFTVNSLLAMDEKAEIVRMQFFLQLQWEAQSDFDDFFPVVIWKNIQNLQKIDEQKWEPAKEHIMKGQTVTVRQHFQADFSHSFDMRNFPRDFQTVLQETPSKASATFTCFR